MSSKITKLTPIATHVEIYKLLHKLGIVDLEVVQLIEERAKIGVITSLNCFWDEKALEKVKIMQIRITTGFHKGWQDGGYTWHVLKVEEGKEVQYALVGGFYKILPCELKDFIQDWLHHILKETDKSFLRAYITVKKEDKDTKFIMQQFKELADKLQDKKTTCRSDKVKEEFPVFQIWT